MSVYTTKRLFALLLIISFFCILNVVNIHMKSNSYPQTPTQTPHFAIQPIGPIDVRGWNSQHGMLFYSQQYLR